MPTDRQGNTANAGPYHGRRVAMGTRHRKEQQVAPAFAALLGASIVVPADLDTDQFGTFSAERPRTLSAIDAARAKALLGMRTAATCYGLASEATYGVLDIAGCTAHDEILLFVDDMRGIEIAETLHSPAVPGRQHVVRSAAEVPASLLGGRPPQGWIVGPAGSDDLAAMSKGLTSPTALNDAVALAVRVSPAGLAIVEPDLRAVHNPSRRAVIARLAGRLAERLRTRCPACSMPGYGRIGVECGLPCRICGSATEMPSADVHGCPGCSHREFRNTVEAAEPRWCPYCNP